MHHTTQDIQVPSDFTITPGNPQGALSGGITYPVLDAENACLDATIIPQLSSTLYIRFDAVAEIYVIHAIEAEKIFEYPKACHQEIQCRGDEFRYLSIDTQYTLPVYIGWGIVVNLIQVLKLRDMI